MTAHADTKGRPGTGLGRRLAPEWAPAFGAVPRSAFLPDLMWPHDITTHRITTVDRAGDPDGWQHAADSDMPIVTQWDDGAHRAYRPGMTATVSSSKPSLVLSMLTDLDAHPGHRVLEVGTGTGWNAGLLAHRLGPASVVTVEIDGSAARAARTALAQLGLDVRVIHGDGATGHPARAPYDRVIATCGVREIPFTWVEQTRPGGIVLVPWGTHFSSTEATARLTVADDGAGARGPFTNLVTFMRLRAQRSAPPDYDSYVTPESRAAAETSFTTLTREELLGGDYDVNAFAIGLRVPDCAHLIDRTTGDGRRTLWFYGLTDHSWAAVVHRDDKSRFTVYQWGQRRLWDEVESAYQWWIDQGRPQIERFGLSMDATGQRAWLDSPERPVRP
ncbi:methyltransferase domain-containing protein [Streptomyces blastmyceticus]|uniref:Protein-L-isoaspartate O-methyltransferase n=1 Tax=Streptomyces blastmyceticus TaxID=68180 RepID=A0ABN0WFW0_9ACTN